MTRGPWMAAMVACLAVGATVRAGPAPASDGLLNEVRQNRHRLQSADRDAPPAETPGAAAPSVDLEEAIRRLRKVIQQPVRRRPASEPSAPAPAPAAKATPQPAAAPAPKSLLSTDDLKHVGEAPLDAFENPLGLADALFLGGHLAEAAVLYDRLLATKAATGPDMAWALFQSANCKRQTDPAGALTLYDRLLAQYADCPWAPAAKVRKALVAWRQKTQPAALLPPATAPKTPPQPERQAP